MILTVNIGNTHITVGGYEQDTLIGSAGGCTPTPLPRWRNTPSGWSICFQLHGASPDQIEGGILGSVVPVLSGRVLAALQHPVQVRAS